MGIMHKLLKIFSSFKGLDERTSNITETSEYASDAENVKFRKDGGIAKRNGYHKLTVGKGGQGNAFYYETDKSTGQVSETLLTADDNLHKMVEKTFTISYNTSTQYFHAYYRVKANDLNSNKGILFQIIELDDSGVETIYTKELGIGDEIIPVSLSDDSKGTCSTMEYTDKATCESNSATWTPTDVVSLKKWLENASGTETGAPPQGKFTMSTPADPAQPAAFLEKKSKTEIVNGTPLSLKYHVWERVVTGNELASPFENAYSVKDSADSENYSFASLNEIMYIGTGFDDLKKYDGNRVYNAGMAAGGGVLFGSMEEGGTDDSRLTGAFVLTHPHSHWVVSNFGADAADMPKWGVETVNLNYSNGTLFWFSSQSRLYVKDTPRIVITSNGSSNILSWNVQVFVNRVIKRAHRTNFLQFLGQGSNAGTQGSPFIAEIETVFDRDIFESSIGLFYRDAATATAAGASVATVGDLKTWLENITHNPSGTNNNTGAPIPLKKYWHSQTSEGWSTTGKHLLYQPRGGYYNNGSYSPWGASENQAPYGYNPSGAFPDNSLHTYDIREKNILNVTIAGDVELTQNLTELQLTPPGGTEIQTFVNENTSETGGGTMQSENITAATVKAGSGISGIGPFFPRNEGSYCTVYQDNGEPYPDKNSCEAASGIWVDTSLGQCLNTAGSDVSDSATGGTCSNTAYSTRSTCEAGGGTWTPSQTVCEATGGQTWYPTTDTYNEWRWKMTYMHKDKKGNIVTGNAGKEFKLTLSRADKTRYQTSETIDQPEISLTRMSSKGLASASISLPVLSVTEGFSTAGGIVASNQTFDNDVTGTCTIGDSILAADCTAAGGTFTLNNLNNITSDYLATINMSSHNFIVGDTAYFKDQYHTTLLNRNVYREFEITAVTSSSITVKVNDKEDSFVPLTDDGKYWFSVSAGDAISNNLRIQIWRTQNLGHSFQGEPDYYLVEEIPHINSIGNKLFYKDSTKDNDLGPLFEDIVELPFINRNYPLPKAKYLTAVTNTLAMGGNPSSTGTLYRMEPGYPEIYSGIGAFYTVDADGGGAISGLGVLNKILYVFQERAINAVAGDLSTGQIRIDVVSNAAMKIGCESHNTIKEVKGRLNFLSEKGLYSIAPGTPIEEVSLLIAPLFDASKYYFNKAVSINWNDNDLYLTMLPSKDTNVTPNLVVAYDTYRDAWTKWTNLDFHRGIAVGISEIYFTGNSSNNLFKFQQTKDTVDYADHDTAILFKYVTNWEALGDATVPKRFLRLKAFSIDSSKTFETDGFILKTSTEKDYDITPVAELDFDFNKWAVDGWGESAYDATGWGDNIVRNKYLKSKLSSKKCKSLRITFENEEINKNILLSGYELEVVTPYRPEIKE